MSVRQLFLPKDYQARLNPEYYDDTVNDTCEITFQPEVYPIAEALLSRTGRHRLIDLGCGNGRKLASSIADRKLGIDFGDNISHCRSNYPETAEWLEVDLGINIDLNVIDEIGVDDVIICSDVIEHLPDPQYILNFLADCFQRGALIITSTPDRELVRGTEHMGPPPNLAHVREWTCKEYRALLTAFGLSPLYLGLTLNNDKDRLLRTIISIHEPLLQLRFRPSQLRPLAIVSCYNEEDVLIEVIEHWIGQGCDVHVLDNWSNDKSWAILTRAAERYGPLLKIERFPHKETGTASWREILTRKEEIAFCHKGRWIIHADADEIRVAPFEIYNLADSMALVEAAGWNRINFTLLNHRPVDDHTFGPGMLARTMPYFEYGTRPGHYLQKKAWLQGESKICLAQSGGHIAEFAQASDCPYQFILHHYPLRSAEHAQRKINHERHGRWSEEEFSLGWHDQYVEMKDEDKLKWSSHDLHSVQDDFWQRHGLQIIMGLQR